MPLASWAWSIVGGLASFLLAGLSSGAVWARRCLRGWHLLRKSSLSQGQGQSDVLLLPVSVLVICVFQEVFRLSCRSLRRAVFRHFPFILCAIYSDDAIFRAFFEVVSGPQEARALGLAGACPC